MTRQEMFDRAVRELRSQGYRIAQFDEGCVYLTGDGLRCAWGHVDPDLTGADDGSVYSLRQANRGIAATLDADGVVFALQLQDCHDCSDSPSNMESRLRSLGDKFQLEWPS